MIRHLAGAAAALAVALAAPGGQSRVGGSVDDGTFRYRIVHEKHGEIGTYTNVVDRRGEEISVKTSIDLDVKLAFLTVHSLEADRTETWSGDRLVRYTSTTEKNGENIRVDGRAEGNQFVIDGPSGRIVAPASVAPTNAWSPHILDADVVMASESGRLYDATVSGGGRETIEVDGKNVSARHFRVQADTTYDLWFNDQDQVVRFTAIDDGDTVSFLLS